MNYNLGPLEFVTVWAFLAALAKIDQPLPPELQQEINQVGKVFTTDPGRAIEQLLDLGKNPVLKEFYDAARLDIQTQYETQECRETEENEDISILLKNVVILETLSTVLDAPVSQQEAKHQYPDFINRVNSLFKRKHK